MNIAGLGSQIESLVQQYRASQRRYVVPLETQKTTLNARLKALADLKSKLEGLNNIVKDLKKTDSTSTLQVFSAKSSDDAILTATASSGQAVGNHSVTVSQLAKQDTVLSARMNSADTSISSGVGSGDRTFTVSINGIDTEITVAIENGDTNVEVMNKLAAAVNESADGVMASVVGDTPSTSRLVIKSRETGSQHEIVLQDGGSGLLSSLGLSAGVLSGRTASSSTEAGYLHTSVSTLDANFVLDGVEIIRGTNVISDVLSGVTLTLRNVSENNVNLNILPDTPKIKENIEKFITSYNDVINYLTSRTSIDADLNVRQIFASDAQVRGLRLDLRMLVGGFVEGIEEGHLNSLYDIGIQVRPDGTLHIGDATKFDEALNSKLDQVVNIFSSENGVAVQFHERLQRFVSRGGMLDKSRDSADSHLKSLNNRIKDVERRIDVRVERFRDEFIRMQNMVAMANQQLQMLNSLRIF